jgi:8-oxo-dGTP diphosphatase
VSGVLRVVVGAAIIRDRHLLAARRSAPSDLAGGWELPGGKVEAAESEVEALVRECREELGVSVHAGERVPGEWVLRDNLVLRVYLATIIAGEPQPLEDHDELRWLPAARLDEVAWLPADVPAIAAVRNFARLD